MVGWRREGKCGVIVMAGCSVSWEELWVKHDKVRAEIAR